MANGIDLVAVELEIEIEAPPEIVFSFLTDPTRMLAWIGQSVQLDPRPGGTLRIDVNGRDIVAGEIEEVDPPHFIAFTWGWDREDTSLPAGSSRVEIRLEPRDRGTFLRLRHIHLPPDVREEHAAGWEHYLARLAVAAGGGDPGPDPLATKDIVHGAPGTSPSDILDEDEKETER